MQIGTAAAQLAAQITDAYDVPTSADGATLQVPGAWLTPATVTPARLDGTVEATWNLYLIAGDHDTPAILDAIGTMFAKLSPLVDGSAEFVELALPNYTAGTMPALSVPITTEIESE